MKSKKLNLLYWLLIIILAVIYLFVIYVVFTHQNSYEYNLFYREKVTAFWAGDGTMTIGVDEVMDFDYSSSEVEYSTALVTDLDLQFVGKGTERVVTDEKLLYLTGDITLYWRWDDSVDSESSLAIYFEFETEVEVAVDINGESFTLSNGETSLTGISYSRENVLKLTSQTGDSADIKLTKVYFSYI